MSTKIGGHQNMERVDHVLRVRLVGRDGRRRFDPASKDRLVAACLGPGVSISRVALEHGINANLLRKWIKDRKASQSVRPSSPSAFIPVHVDGSADSVVSRSRTAATGLPAICDEVRGAAPNRASPFSVPAKVNASLPNGVKLSLECGDVDALRAIIGALGHVQTGG